MKTSSKILIVGGVIVGAIVATYFMVKTKGTNDGNVEPEPEPEPTPEPEPMPEGSVSDNFYGTITLSVNNTFLTQKEYGDIKSYLYIDVPTGLKWPDVKFKVAIDNVLVSEGLGYNLGNASRYQVPISGANYSIGDHDVRVEVHIIGGDIGPITEDGVKKGVNISIFKKTQLTIGS